MCLCDYCEIKPCILRPTEKERRTVEVIDCPYYKNGKPTNADRIRAMSDGELARFLAEKVENEYILSCKRLSNETHMLTATQIEAIRHTCYCTWMQWLKQPAE